MENCQKILRSLFFCIILAVVFVKIPAAFALDMSNTANPGLYTTASLVNDSGTIYFITGNTKVPFTNYKAFTGLGYSLNNVVKGDLSGYNLSQTYVINTANTAHPWGSWLNYNGVVYYSSQSGLIGVPSAEVFLSNSGKWNLVVKANKYDISILNSTAKLPVLTDNDSRVVGQQALMFGGAGAQSNQPVITPNTVVPPIATTSTSTAVVSFVPQLVLPANVYASSSATFSAPSADPHMPLVYNFIWDDGTPSNSLTISSAVHTYYLPGVYMFEVSVVDSLSNTYSTTVPLTVILPPNQTPSVPSLTVPSGIIVGAQATVTASASDPQNLSLTYYYSWGDNSPDTVSGTSATHVYSASGSYLVTVTATNTLGFSSLATSSLYIAP